LSVCLFVRSFANLSIMLNNTLLLKTDYQITPEDITVSRTARLSKEALTAGLEISHTKLYNKHSAHISK